MYSTSLFIINNVFIAFRILKHCFNALSHVKRFKVSEHLEICLVGKLTECIWIYLPISRFKQYFQYFPYCTYSKPTQEFYMKNWIYIQKCVI